MSRTGEKRAALRAQGLGGASPAGAMPGGDPQSHGPQENGRAAQEKNALGTLYAIGAGPGDPELLTLKAARILGRVSVVFAASSSKNDYSLAQAIVSRHISPQTPVVRLAFPMIRDAGQLQAAWDENAASVLDALSTGRDAAFITLGDPMTYSTFVYLWRTLLAVAPQVRTEIVPGVSSIQASAAAAGFPLAESGQNVAILSGVDDPARLRKALESCDSAVILKTYRSFSMLRDLLASMGLADKAVLVSRVGMEGEQIVRGLGCVEGRPAYFSLILVKK